jgi:Ca2+-transporting ATPase
MVQLSKKNIICKFPEIMDTVGDLSIICTDKTGTLTTNLMTVVAVADYNDICEKKNKEIEEIRKDLNRYKHLISIGMFCNNAEINTLDSKCIGDPTEGALLHLGEKTELSIEKTRNKYKRVFEQPFDSNRKMMTTVYQTKKGYTSFTKGAAESILNFCDHIQTNNGIRKITDKDKKIIIDYLENMSSQALRVLGLASTNFTKIPNKNSNYEYSMTFKGLVGMIDPPKKNASKTINILKNAGISVAMITGDHPITALAIARNIGITNKDDSNILTNTEIDAISDKQLEAIIPNTHVFARISPENKLRIVKAFKKDNIVAMIGDGTNDAPSLKEADAGIAMAGIGTDVAKDAASILLLDDKFETLSTVINEGRKISRNIKNVVSFILSTNIATWLLVLLTTYIFSINVLNISQRLLLDLATDMLPCIYIGLNGNNLDLMKKRNKKNNDHTSFFNKSLVYITIVNTLFILISILTVFFIL